MSSIEQAIFNSMHFRWIDPFVHIDTTDSEEPQTPPVDTETAVSLVAGNGNCDDKIYMWKKKLGELLVQDYLAVRPGVRNKKKNYYLAEFPKHYVFYVRMKNGGSKGVRYDSYLMGGRHIFRSPNEFVFHAAWLMAGAVEGECGCKYCDKDNKEGQRGRNNQLEINRQAVHDRISSARASGVNIKRGANVMNKRAFLKNSPPAQVRAKRRSSLGEGSSAKPMAFKRSSLQIGSSSSQKVSSEGSESGSVSSSGGRMEWGYDEEGDEEMEE